MFIQVGRKEILEMYGDKVVLGGDVEVDVMARRTAGMSGMIFISSTKKMILELCFCDIGADLFKW